MSRADRSAVIDTPTAISTDAHESARRKGRTVSVFGRTVLVVRPRLLTCAATVLLVLNLLDLGFADRWWPWLIAGMVPWHVWVGAAVALIGVALIRRRPRWWPALLAVCALALSLVQSGLHLPATMAPASNADIKVVQWNTQFWDSDEDASTFAARLRAMQADVLLLQEHGVPAAGDTIRGITDLDDIRAWFPGYSVAVNHDLVTVSRFPITRISKDPAGGALLTRIAAPRGPVTMLNVHLVAPYDLSSGPWSPAFWHATDSRGALQERQLRWVGRHVTPATYVAGDFNATASMRDLPDRFPGLRDVSTSPWDGTWGPGPFLLWRVDWQLAGSAVCVSGYDTAERNESSDHAPTTVRLRARTGASC